MTMRLLTLNAGSSSIKFALFEAPPPGAHAAGPALRILWTGQADGLGPGLQANLRVRDAKGNTLTATALQDPDNTHTGAMRALLRWQDTQTANAAIDAIGHRIVHGGTLFRAPVRIDAQVLAHLTGLEPLAPLHQPHNLAGVRAAMQAFAGVPQVACFDTAFHATQPAINQRFALPQALHDQGVRRYGFHGLSYESIVAQFPALDAKLATGRVVVAHLGNGASLCAVNAGQSVATTMSFSPLDGLTMGTRCGQLDAAVVLHLLREKGMGVDEVTELLFRQSGLLGLSGLSSDMRELEASTLPAAQLAIDHFIEQVVQQIGRMAAALRGTDAIVFTGGIGENATALRQRILAQCAWMGLEIGDPCDIGTAVRLSSAASRVAAWVCKTDEEAVIARHTANAVLPTTAQ